MAGVKSANCSGFKSGNPLFNLGRFRVAAEEYEGAAHVAPTDARMEGQCSIDALTARRRHQGELREDDAYRFANIP
jgi:hypothetical protein